MSVQITPLVGGVPDDLGQPELPGSKSHTQRAMVLAAFSPGSWDLIGALRSEDTELLGEALNELGAQVRWEPGRVCVQGRADGPVEAEVFLGENATGMRILLALVPALGGSLRIDGRQGLRARPAGPSLQLLASLGASVVGERLPLVVDGSAVRWPDRLEVDASTTTQVASGALMAAAVRRGGIISVTFPSAPAYLRVTARICRLFGWQVIEREAGDKLEFTVAGRARGGGELVIPPDPSARVFPLVLAALHGKDGAAVLPADTDPHPDWAVDGDLEKLRSRGGRLVLADIGRRPDCLPALAVAAATRGGYTHFVNLPTLRGKESDRLRAMALGLDAAGVDCAELPDGLVVKGPLRVAERSRLELPTAPDHRIVMSLSLLGTVLPGGVRVDHREAVGKSWPGFFDWLGRVAVVE